MWLGAPQLKIMMTERALPGRFDQSAPAWDARPAARLPAVPCSQARREGVTRLSDSDAKSARRCDGTIWDTSL